MEAVEADGIFTDMGVNLKNDTAPGIGQFIECAERYDDAITYPVNIHHTLGDRLLKKNAVETSDHIRGLPSFENEAGRWQRPTRRPHRAAEVPEVSGWP